MFSTGNHFFYIECNSRSGMNIIVAPNPNEAFC